MKHRAFTLIELLVAIGIIAALAGILMPALLAAQRRARQATCVSNLRQLGHAVTLYAQDEDNLFPHAGDPEDLNTDAWKYDAGGRYWAEVRTMRPLPEVMKPYVGSKDLWHCPADNGFDFEGVNENVPLRAHPSSFVVYGSSYYYKTGLILERKRLGTVVVYEKTPPYAHYGPSDVCVLNDGVGSWHGGRMETQGRRNVLFADGHVSALSQFSFEHQWHLALDPPHPKENQ